MPDKDRDSAKDEPSLELPSLSLPGLRRRKHTKETEAPTSPVPPEPAEPSAPDTSAAEETRTITPPPVEQTRKIAPEPVEPPATAPGRRDEPRDEAAAAPAPATSPGAASPDRKGFHLPALPGPVAAALTGVVVGLVGTLLTYLAMLGCEAVRGTSTCGGPGFFFLVAILIVMILLGMTLLKAWQITDPGSTSFLAVGLVAVAVLVVLIDVIFSGWMFLAVPLVAAGAYALSHWVTTRFVDEDRDRHR